MIDSQKIDLQQQASFKEVFDNLLSEQRECVFCSTDTITMCLRKVIKRKKWNPQKFVEKTGLTAVLYSRIKNKDDHNITLEPVIAICIGAQLSFSLSIELIQKAGYSLNGSKIHTAYKALLMSTANISIDKANQFLISQGFKAISDKNMYKN